MSRRRAQSGHEPGFHLCLVELDEVTVCQASGWPVKCCPQVENLGIPSTGGESGTFTTDLMPLVGLTSTTAASRTTAASTPWA